MTGMQHITNDNEKIPAVRGRRRVRALNTYSTAPSFPTGARPQQKPQDFQTTPFAKHMKSTTSPKARSMNVVALVVWLASACALFFVHRNTGVPLYEIGAAVVFGWASLFLLFVSKTTNKKVARGLGVLGVLASLTLLAYTLMLEFNMHISMELSLVLGMAITLTLGALTQEKFPLIVSAALLAIWIGYTQTGTKAPELIWLIPTILLAQLFVSSRLNSRAAMTLLIAAGLAWLGLSLATLVEGSHLSDQQALSMLVLGGLGYNRFGKLLQDKSKPTGLMHTNIAWGLAAISALALQYLWSGNAIIPENIAAIGQNLNSIISTTICAGLAILIFLLGLARSRSGYQSPIETITLTGLAIAMIIVFNKPDLFVGSIAYISTSPTQFIAFVTGGILAAAAVGMTVNGARRGVPIMILIGIATLFAELYLVIPQLIAHPEHLYAFGYSCLFSLLFLGLFAQFKHKTSTPRYLDYVPSV